MKKKSLYYCPENMCNHAPLIERELGLTCPNGHEYTFIKNTNIPRFVINNDIDNDYSHANAAIIHDNALQWVFKTFNTDETTLRKNLISRLHLSKGNNILITGAGAGNDLPYIMESLQQEGTIYAQDISEPMLLTAHSRYALDVNPRVNLYFSVSDATNLPFADNYFDAAYHFGGLNLYSDIQKGIYEMNRVVKCGGRIVISDEGAAPWLKETELGKMLINNNPLYAYDAPLDLLPPSAQNVTLSWELNHFFYVIDFTVSSSLPKIDLDVPHVGTRGGTIRSRYHGQLEGINPLIKNRVYAEAERQGISRVELLERILENI